MANIPVAETKKEVNQIDSSGKGKTEEKKDEEMEKRSRSLEEINLTD